MKTCVYEGCDKRHFCKGYCKGHDSQIRRGAELSPLRPRQASTGRPDYDALVDAGCVLCVLDLGKLQPFKVTDGLLGRERLSAWERAYGPLDGSLVGCDASPICLNPSHFRVVYSVSAPVMPNKYV